MTASLRASAAIVGAAESEIGAAAEGTRPIDLMAQASLRALTDAGLTPSDVDGVFAATTQLPMAPLNLALELGIEARYSDATNVGGSSFMFHLGHARAAIAAGLCDVALIAYGSTQRLVGRSSASVQELDPWEAPFRPAMPVTAYALAASRHMHEFGTTREQLASVAVAARSWAAMNPGAWSREPLSVEDVLASRMVADPLTLRDCCLVTDGGAAIVVTSAERAADAAAPAGRRARDRRGAQPSAHHRDAVADDDRGHPVRRRGVRRGGRQPSGGRCRSAVRRVHDHADPVPRGPRLLREGRGRAFRRVRRDRAGRRSPAEHQRRRALLHAPGHVRAARDRRGRAAAARRVRRTGRCPAARSPSPTATAASFPARRRWSSEAPRPRSVL